MATVTAPQTAPRTTHARHIVLGLTVAVYMITYMDRVCIGHAAPEIQKEFAFDELTMGWIFSAFYLPYALGQVPGGWLADRFGPRRVLSAVVIWWSAFTAATALAWNRMSMYGARMLFGLGEAGAFPTATRALSLWLPKTERGFAQGITHAGARLGAAATPPIVVFLILSLGWRSVFYIFGGVGALWAIAWYLYYRDRPADHPGVNAAELALIQQGETAARSRVSVPWRRLLVSRNMWVFCAMYFFYAYTVSIYLTWLPTYLQQARGFTMTQMGWVHMAVLAAAMVGDLVGGWTSDILARRTGNLRFARRSVAITGFLVAAGCIIPATLTQDRILSAVLTAIGLFGLELTVGVSWAVAVDIGPQFAGSVSGFMNMCGNLGSTVSPVIFAVLRKHYDWPAPFLVACVLLVVAAACYLRIDPDDKIVVTDKDKYAHQPS